MKFTSMVVISLYWCSSGISTADNNSKACMNQEYHKYENKWELFGDFDKEFSIIKNSECLEMEIIQTATSMKDCPCWYK